MALNPGTTLMNGRYRIIKLLGRGGFGFVYLAQDTLMNEEVAIKELVPALIDDAMALKRFITEAKAAMRLRHQNIVATYNVFADGENYYLVMEYMAGGSLEDLLRRQRKLKITQALTIMGDICEGLTHAHHIGIIHCDIKPANVLFAADGTAKLTDFGIAYISPKLVSRSWRTARDFAAGTLLYMAPEQVDGVRDDPRVDIYALGAMLYQMLTGCPYLDFDLRETPGAQADNVNRIRRQMPVPPRTVNPAIPKGLESVVLKALAKEPGDRYQSLDQMLKALGEIGEKKEREPQTTAPEFIRPSRLVPIIGGVVIAVVFLMAVYWILALRGPMMPAAIPSPSPTAIAVISTPTPAPSVPAATPTVTASPSVPTATPVPQPSPPTVIPSTVTVEELAQSLHEPWAAGEWEEVIRLIEQILAIKPDDAQMIEYLYAAHVNYGHQLAAEGRLEEAKLEFIRALDVNPDGGEAIAELQALAAGETPVPPTTSIPQPQYIIHVVQQGEWLSKIARMYGTTEQAIMEANGLTSTTIHPGQQLRIPIQ